jgi:predicted ribosomally synthesized six-cysteine peptide SCIFF
VYHRVAANKTQIQIIRKRVIPMKHIETLNTRDMAESLENGGCGECQTSCQSACKTSCGIANQKCEKADKN